MKQSARVIVLDMLAPVKRDEFGHLIEEFETIDWLAQRMKKSPGSFGPPYNWPEIGRTVQGMMKDAQDASSRDANGVFPIYIAGRAPLPLFVLLGQACNLSGQTSPDASIVVLNPQRGGSWVKYELGKRKNDGGGGFFDIVDIDNERPLRSLEKTTGRVAIFVSTVGAPAPIDAIKRFLEKRGETYVGTVSIRTAKPGDVTSENIADIVEDLRRNLPLISQHFPNTNKFALIVAGPVPLACAVGGALNPNQYPDVWLGNYAAPEYDYAFTLPFRFVGRPIVSNDDGDKLARRGVLDALIEGIEEMRRGLTVKDFPAWAGGGGQPKKWIGYLRDLTIVREPVGDAFGLRIVTRQLTFGNALLEAMRDKPTETQKRFGQLLLLHELYHDGQGLRSTNHVDIGRAGVVLEQVDFIADAFALAVLIRWDLRTGGRDATERPGPRAAQWVNCALIGMDAFDKLEYGEKVEHIYERRLRRYLTWHLQMARASALQPNQDARDNVAALFEKRLVVELAPLQGHLDANFEKVITKAQPNTELFVALDRHLIREAKNAAFDPGALVDAVFARNHEVIAKAMMYVVDQHRDVLVPWAMGS